MAITIEFVRSGLSESEITLTRLPVTIGRDPKADLQLCDCYVSRQHCEIDELNGKPLVRDLNSENGTFVNGETVQEAVVSPDDRITVGQTNFRARC
jgi:pSer/pThr/pTyr-binding forkhead associated (FHA) protein